MSEEGVDEYQPALNGMVDPAPEPNEGSSVVDELTPAKPVTVTKESNENADTGVTAGCQFPPALSEWVAPAIDPLTIEWL